MGLKVLNYLIMRDKDYLKLAIKVAEQSKENVKCGCIIVQNGKILAESFNSQHIDNQAINHAEIKAVIESNKKAGLRILENTVAYCSCEPCAMCITAFSYAKVERIIFNKSMKDLFPNDTQAKFNSEEFIKNLNFVPKLEQLLV
jgi:tRNA(Arg) A34 adenosine deaminase TadA